MKLSLSLTLKKLIALSSLCVIAALPAKAQVTVQVDSTKTWSGWMNVSDLVDGWQGGYLWGQAWAPADLQAFFTGTSTLTLMPNTNVSNPTDAYWVKPDGTGNKWMEANFYVDVGTSFQGQSVTFQGEAISNTLIYPWDTVAVIKEFAPGYAYIGSTTAPLIQGLPFSVTRQIAPGNIVQYGFMTTGPNVNPTNLVNVGHVVVKVNNSDPSITGEPANARVQVGGSASFTVTAVGSSALSYQWKRYGTNLVNSSRISGATSATLSISNAQPADDTTYTVTVSNASGSVDSLPARLRVLSAADFANLLDNPSFELEVTQAGLVPEPWFNFSGAALASTNEVYGFDPNFPIQAKDGTNVVRIFNAGEWNGIFQDVPAAPGEVFTADGWFYMSSLEQLVGETTAHIEIQFRAGPTPLAMYTSAEVTNSSALDTWMFLPATNGVPSGYTQISTTNSTLLVAPPGTDRIRYQITLHNISGGAGNVYVDALRLTRQAQVQNPVTLNVADQGANIVISWTSQTGANYQVVQKTSLMDAQWTSVGDPVAGDGTVKTMTLPKTGAQRFFRVLTQ